MFGFPHFSLSSIWTGAESLMWFPWNGTSIFFVCCYCCCLEGKPEGEKREKRKINRLVLNLWVLSEALGLPSVISIDYFTAWQIRIQIYFSKYHVCWGNGCHTRTILLKRLTQYPIEKPICYLFMTDWCCFCGVAAYTCRKTFLLNAYSPNSTHLVFVQDNAEGYSLLVHVPHLFFCNKIHVGLQESWKWIRLLSSSLVFICIWSPILCPVAPLCCINLNQTHSKLNTVEATEFDLPLYCSKLSFVYYRKLYLFSVIETQSVYMLCKS